MARPVRIAEVPPRFPLQVQSVELLADEVYCLRLDRHPLPWTPGDCVTLYPPGKNLGNPYSFSGPPEAPWVEFWIRRIPGGQVSGPLCDLRTGGTVEVSPPFGWFRPLEPASAPRLYLATGTGIAPFLSALRHMPPEHTRILWGMRHPLPVPDILRSTDLTRCISRNNGGDFSGRITDLLPDLDLAPGVHVYLCGLDEMIREASEGFRRKGLPENQLHAECFFTASSP